MKTKINKVYIIALGVVIAICLAASTVDSTKDSSVANSESDILAKYKSSIPIVTAPLHILAKGLNVINKKKSN